MALETHGVSVQHPRPPLCSEQSRGKAAIVHHVDVLILIIGIVLVTSVLIALAALVMRRRIFAGEASDEWRRVQKQLSRAEKMRVRRATMRQQRVEPPELEQAQLAYIRCCQHVSERSPLIAHPKSRVYLGLAYLIVALGDAFFAIGGHGLQRVESAASAVIFATLAVMWTFVLSRNLRRRQGQMARLRRRIEQN